MLEFPRIHSSDMPTSLVSQFLKRPALFILSAAALMMGVGEVQAWGFGRAQSSAVLGVPLDFSVALRLDASESPPECLAADVSAGDIPVPRSAVFVSLESAAGGPVVRVRTTVAIDEPLVTIRLSAGCGSSTSRRFTLFADPPGHLAAPVLAQAEALQTAASPPAAAVTSPAAVPAAQALPSPAPAASPGQGAPLRTASTAATGAPLASTAPAAAASSPGRGAASTRARLPDGAAPLADASAQAAQQGTARAPRARLQLDPPTSMASTAGAAQGSAVAAALQSAQDAASAARAAASAAQARAAEMQKSIDALRQESQANREAVARLTRALEGAQGSTPAWLWAALAALGGLNALFFVRMRRQQSGGPATPWWSASAAAAAESPGQTLDKTAPGQVTEVLTPLGSVTSVETPTLPTVPTLPVMPMLPPDAAVETLVSKPEQSAPPLPEVEAEPDPDTLASASMDELLDLQQQADFFSILGQEDAAQKLLAEHLRQTRGDYPLPYLQLMDMCRRRSDEAGFERVRSRFQQRFGITWPDWQEPAQEQRHLEDCPDLLLDVERVWQDPARAMGALEALLRAGDRRDSLDPTVQADLLFLFTLARDLRDQPVPAPAPLPLPAAVVAVAAPISGAADIDLDLGMDQGSSSPASLDLSLDFDLPTAEPSAGADAIPTGLGASASRAPAPGLPEFSRRALRAEQPPALPVIDLPLAGAEYSLGTAAALAKAAFVPVGASKEATVDLRLDEMWNPGPAAPPPGPKPDAQALSLEFPDLDLPRAKELALPQAAAVDLELSFDAPDFASLPPPLSADEQRAASRFSLFSEEFDQVKKR